MAPKKKTPAKARSNSGSASPPPKKVSKKTKKQNNRTFERRFTQHYKYPRKTQHGSEKKQFTNVPKALLEKIEAEANAAGMGVIKKTSFGLEITGKDINTILESVKDDLGIQPDTAYKWLRCLADHVNLTWDQHEPPYIAVADYMFFGDLDSENYDETCKALNALGLTREKFFNVKHIFIQLSFDARHSALLVISPNDRIVDIYDSLPKKGKREELLVKAFKLLDARLGRFFVPSKWLARAENVLHQQDKKSGDCPFVTVANATCLAFGYPYDYENAGIENMNHKKRRVAYELWNGGFHEYQGDDGDEHGVCAYQLGSFDVKRNPHAYGFYALSKQIIDALPEHCRYNLGKYVDILSKEDLEIDLRQRSKKYDNLRSVLDPLLAWIHDEKYPPSLEESIVMVEYLDHMNRVHEFSGAKLIKKLNEMAKKKKKESASSLP
jgi:hypothetical protein